MVHEGEQWTPPGPAVTGRDSSAGGDRPYETMMLENQTCVATGPSRGIGRGIAEDLGRHGAEAVNYRSSEAGTRDVVDATGSGTE